MSETVLANPLLTEYNIHKNDRHYRNKKSNPWTKTKQKKQTFYTQQIRSLQRQGTKFILYNILHKIRFQRKYIIILFIIITFCRLGGYQYTTNVCYRGIVME